MRSASIGTRAGSRSLSPDLKVREGGFTLLEALVALALILAFAAAVVPFLFQARSIMTLADRRVAAHVLLRSLISAPHDRSAVASAREGESSGLRWRVVAGLIRNVGLSFEAGTRRDQRGASAPRDRAPGGRFRSGAIPAEAGRRE